jgi:predicted transcriptional regulator
MVGEIPPELLSSPSRLKIADLLSVRPRTLGELADETGISVQAVLKHLEKLDRLGIVEKRKVSGRDVSARKVYLTKGAFVGDYSYGDLTIVNMTRRGHVKYESADPVGELESLAEDTLVQRRRIREQVRKLSRMISQLVDSEDRLSGIIEGLGLDDEECLLVQTMFTEETLGDAERALARTHGMRDPRRSIERALAKARRSVNK